MERDTRRAIGAVDAYNGSTTSDIIVNLRGGTRRIKSDTMGGCQFVWQPAHETYCVRHRPFRNMIQPRSLCSLCTAHVAALALLLAAIPFGSGTKAHGAEPKTRLIVLTDIGGREPDDEQSLIRLLTNANHFEIKALIANTSAWQPTKVHPELIRTIVEAYGKVRSNLLVHAPGFPTAEPLLATIRTGRTAVGMTGVGDGLKTEASNLIFEVVDRGVPRRCGCWLGAGPPISRRRFGT